MPTKKKTSTDVKKDNEAEEYERQRRQILDGILDGKTQNQSASSTSPLVSQYDPPQPQSPTTSYSSNDPPESPSAVYSPPLSGGSLRDAPPSYEEVSASTNGKKLSL